MFRAVCRSSSGAPTVLAASGLHTHVETARNQVWVETPVEFPLRLDYGRSPHAYVNQRLQIQLGLLMISDIPLETCWAFNVLWNNKFRYQVASCWLLLLSHLFTGCLVFFLFASWSHVYLACCFYIVIVQFSTLILFLFSCQNKRHVPSWLFGCTYRNFS